jgi:hypothetical protein
MVGVSFDFAGVLMGPKQFGYIFGAWLGLAASGVGGAPPPHFEPLTIETIFTDALAGVQLRSTAVWNGSHAYVAQVGSISCSVAFEDGVTRESGYVIRDTAGLAVSPVFLGTHEIVGNRVTAIDGSSFDVFFESVDDGCLKSIERLTPWAAVGLAGGAGFHLFSTILSFFFRWIEEASSDAFAAPR